MFATVGNMRRLTRKLNPGKEDKPIGYLNPLSSFGIVAYDPATEDTFSADAGDYFWAPDSHMLKSMDGNRSLRLGRKRTTFVPVQEMEESNG